MPFHLPEKGLAAVLRVGVFTILALLGLMLFAWVLAPIAGYLATSALSVLLAATVANAICIRIYERGSLADIGFAWNQAAVRNLLLGAGGGIGAAALILGGPLLLGLAELSRAQESPDGAATFAFFSVVLLFGAVGEEMLFHGYAFQVLLARLHPWLVIGPVSLLFAAAHSGNLHVSPLALVNTGLWGMVLGCAFWRSGDLWLPIGLHFGWNWCLPLFGVNLSGFTMNVTGYVMRWKLAPEWSGGAYGPEGGLLTSLVLILLGMYLWKAPIRRQTPLLLAARSED